MPKYWGKQIFSLGRRDGEKKERERLNDGNNNGQLGIANATSGGARKPPRQKKYFNIGYSSFAQFKTVFKGRCLKLKTTRMYDNQN